MASSRPIPHALDAPSAHCELADGSSVNACIWTGVSALGLTSKFVDGSALSFAPSILTKRSPTMVLLGLRDTNALASDCLLNS